MPTTLEFAARGAGGEPVDLLRTFNSHGVADLPPMAVTEDGRGFTVTLPVPGARPRIVTVAARDSRRGTMTILGRRPGDDLAIRTLAQLRHVLALDEDLSEFYALAADDPMLAWVTSGAGRMIRNPTVFETVVKTICTTNCAWGATVRMVRALVTHLGEEAPNAPREGWTGRAFPTAQAMAEAGDDFYRDVARAGYRGAYLTALARAVADGDLDLEALGAASREELSDDELDARLQMLPGVGPYAAAHIMMMLGRHSRLILDSWTRPKYARLVGRKKVADATIRRRFARYRDYAGLAFWLFLTRDWVPES